MVFVYLFRYRYRLQGLGKRYFVDGETFSASSSSSKVDRTGKSINSSTDLRLEQLKMEQQKTLLNNKAAGDDNVMTVSVFPDPGT